MEHERCKERERERSKWNIENRKFSIGYINNWLPIKSRKKEKISTLNFNSKTLGILVFCYSSHLFYIIFFFLVFTVRWKLILFPFSFHSTLEWQKQNLNGNASYANLVFYFFFVQKLIAFSFNFIFLNKLLSVIYEKIIYIWFFYAICTVGVLKLYWNQRVWFKFWIKDRERIIRYNSIFLNKQWDLN